MCSRPDCPRTGARQRDLFELLAEDPLGIAQAPAPAASSVGEPEAEAPPVTSSEGWSNIRKAARLLRLLLENWVERHGQPPRDDEVRLEVHTAGLHLGMDIQRRDTNRAEG